MKIEREPDTQYIAFISYGKDSTAMLEAIHQLGWPLDRIITTDVWATDDIEADLPEIVEFKSYADREIEKRYGIPVEHKNATTKSGEKLTYEKMFYKVPNRRRKTHDNKIIGFPNNMRPWCKDLKKVKIDGGGQNRTVYWYSL